MIERFSSSENGRDRDAVVAAVQRFLKADAGAKIVCERLEADFARVSAKSAKAQPIFGFAKRGPLGRWEVLGMGSFFEPAFYQQHGIPERLQQK